MNQLDTLFHHKKNNKSKIKKSHTYIPLTKRWLEGWLFQNHPISMVFGDFVIKSLGGEQVVCSGSGGEPKQACLIGQ
jgi:hypothetical protein